MTSSRSTRPLFEPLEQRLVLATAGGVENVLLPEFMAQMADPNGNQLPASDAWWALRSQRNLAIDEPVSNVQWLAAHNAFNSLNEGFHIVPLLAPNQILSLTGQLDVGARLIELDIHDPLELYGGPSLERRLILRHGPFPSITTRFTPYELDSALTDIRQWMSRGDNRNEIVFLDFEDATEQADSGADDPLIPKLLDYFGAQIYTPDERAADGAWPSRAEMLARGKRVIIFTHRNDSGNGRFGTPQAHLDPNGHLWYGASLAFRADSAGDLAHRGNFEQMSTDDFSSATEGLPENADSFFSVQGDGIRNFTARRYNTADVRAAANINVNFTKMDFLFGDDEDAGLGANLSGTDPLFDIPEDNRVALLESAVWSWAKDDPAVDRQVFQDLAPNDGTGAAQFAYLASRGMLDAAVDLLEVGAAARNNGRDVAYQFEGRWFSARPAPSVFARHFAARSVSHNGFGGYEWRVTAGSSHEWADGYAMVNDEFGPDFVFSAPVNGFQNARLAAAAGANSVWMNVHDFDRDGHWRIGNANLPPQITSVSAQPTSADEGSPVRLTVDFTDAADDHTLLVDWGDGSTSTVSVAAGQLEAIASHVYRDDHPQSGTPSDTFTVEVTLTDPGGGSDTGSAQVTIANVRPVVTSFVSSAPLPNPAAESQAVTFTASFTDVGVLDTHSAVVDWGDGSAPQPLTVTESGGAGTATGSHAYTAGGIYTVTLTLTDDDTGARTATTTAVVTGVGLANGTLFVIGSSAPDRVELNQTETGQLKAHATFISESFRAFDLSAVDRIVSYLGQGDDGLTISAQVRIPAVIHGGPGSDVLAAGGGHAALLGDDGDDRLLGGTGRTILVGGTGRDLLLAGRADDVLLGGSTTADPDDDILITAATAWGAEDPYPFRVAAIDAMFVVTDDGSRDVLTGGSDQDLFYDGVGDILPGVKPNESVL